MYQENCLKVSNLTKENIKLKSSSDIDRKAREGQIKRSRHDSIQYACNQWICRVLEYEMKELQETLEKEKRLRWFYSMG